MEKLLSYILPITKKIASKYSGTLEITWHNGKKHLNTKNANYSYGSLQRILKFSLEKIQLKDVNSILLLGLGGGSVIETLRNDFNYQKHITAIEIDPKIIEIANEEFNLTSNKNLEIICEDALTYMKQNTSLYNLIIIDLFIDIEVPMQFLSISFWEDVNKAKSINGCVIFNASLQKTKNEALEKVISFLQSNVYKVDVYKKVNNTNTIIIAQGL